MAMLQMLLVWVQAAAKLVAVDPFAKCLRTGCVHFSWFSQIGLGTWECLSACLCLSGPSLLGLLIVRSSNLLVLGVNLYWCQNLVILLEGSI